MSNPTGGATTNGNDADDRQFYLEQLFIKDFSFEAPNAPEILQSLKGEPDVKLNLRHAIRSMEGDRFEVVLHLNVQATLNEETVFMAELDQAGLFQIKGYEDEERRRLLGIFCPNTLFPYAREAISSVVAKGGFPPLILQPINFESLYAQAIARKAAETQ